MNEEKCKLARIERIFFEVLECPEDKRVEHLGRVCGGDVSLRAAIEEMLRADQDDSGLIDTAPWSVQQVGRAVSTVDAEDPLTHPGSQIGRYRLVEFLGAGGMGTVWLAERTDDEFQQRVALKLIKRGLDTDEVLRRFRRERQVLAQLEHPNIARLIDGGATDDGRPYLVMEYVAGRPIDVWCDEKRLGIRDRLKLFLSVCAAVQHAHSKLTIHRDLKPSNILIADDGQPKLLDFGLAKLLRQDGSPDSLLVTTASVRMLTPRYASPEQVRSEQVSTASDVFSLGVLLYELLTGHSPYQLRNRSHRELEHAVIRADPIKPSAASSSPDYRVGGQTDANTVFEYRSTGDTQLRRMLRGDLDTIILKTLAKAPPDRYETVAALASDLQSHLDARPIAAVAENATTLLRKFVRRNRSFSAALVGSVLVLLGATVVSFSYAGSEAQARAEAERRTKIAESVNSFLNDDILATVDPDNTDNPDLTMREVLDRAASGVEGRFSEDPLVEASIRQTIGKTYHSLGLAANGIPHLRRAVDLYEAEEGMDHTDTRNALRELADAQRDENKGNWDVALVRDLLARDIRTDGLESATAMSTLLLLAQIDPKPYENLTSLETLEMVLAWQRLNLGDRDDQTLSTMRVVANEYVFRNELDKGEPLTIELWQASRELYTESDPRTLKAASIVITLYKKQGEFDKAIEMLEDSIRIHRATKPKNYFGTGIMLGHLGQTLIKIERYDEAELALIEGHAILSASLGPDAGWTGGVARILAKLYEQTGQVDKAAQWREKEAEALVK